MPATPLHSATRRPVGPAVPVWVGASFTLFLVRAFLFSTWVSRGPDVKSSLGVGAFEMGLVIMAYAVGGLAAINFAGALTHRFGSRVCGVACYLVASCALALVGPAITHGQTIATVVLLVAFGAPIAVADFVGNHEGALADKAAKRSVLSTIHGAFGLGMLSAAAVTSWCLASGVSMTSQFLVVAVSSAVVGCVACFGLPPQDRAPLTVGAADKPVRKASVWSEKRNLLIALIGFAFVVAETAAGSWVPIALSGSGFSDADAALALSFFWALVTVVRLLGGFLVDRYGRYHVVLGSALVTSAGLTLFMASGFVALPWVSLVLWGTGMALGFPMCVSAMSDDPARAAARVNMMVTVVYAASLFVGPALGALASFTGIYIAFAIPMVLMLTGAAISKVVSASTNAAVSRP